MIDCDKDIERKLSSLGNTLHVYVKEKKREVISRDVIAGKDSETERLTILRGSPRRSRCAKGMCDADSDCTHAAPLRFRSVSFDKVQDQVRQEIGGCTTNNGGSEFLLS